MSTTSNNVQEEESDYRPITNDIYYFYDLMAYFLRANCECISLTCMDSKDKRSKLVIIRSNTSKQKLSNLNNLAIVNKNINEVIQLIKDFRNFKKDPNRDNNKLKDYKTTFYKKYINI